MALSFLKKWFSKSSVFESLKRWHDSPLRPAPRWSKRPIIRLRLGLELLEDRRVPAAPIQYFIIPMPEQATIAAMDGIVVPATSGSAGTTMDSITTIVTTENNTIIYYDQWENGYESILGTPTQTTGAAATQIWGDGITTNGSRPGGPAGDPAIPRGTVITLRNNVTNANTRDPNVTPQATVFTDAGDIVGSDQYIAITRAQLPTAMGSIISSAVEVYDTRYYDTSFVSPVGTNTGPVAVGDSFDYTALFVTASLDNTRIQIDTDNNPLTGTGGFEIDVIRNKGQFVGTNGTVLQGARVVADKPVQTQLITGDFDSITTNAASRSYTLFSTNQLSNNYFTPVTTLSAAAPAALYAHNPGTSPITVRYDTRTATNQAFVTNLAPGATSRLQIPLDSTSGIRVYTTGGENFLVIGTADDNNRSFDWGFSLQPVSSLSQIAQVALGVGNSLVPPTGNNSPIWLTSAGVKADGTASPLTTVSIDRDGDGTVDTTVNLTPLESVRLTDTTDNDNDNSGMKMFTTDGTLIAAVWGENASTAGATAPDFDAGTTVPAIPVPEFFKSSTFATGGDANGDTFYNSGDTVRYTLRINQKSTQSITSAVITDTLPVGVSYVPGTTMIQVNAGAPVSIPDNTLPGTPFPLDGTGFTIATISPNDVILITFDTLINAGQSESQLHNKAQLAYNVFKLPAVNDIDLRGTVSDTIYYDVDGDGTQDVGEPGIVGATVTLTWAGPDGNLATATDNQTFTRTTGANGIYPAFTNLPAGTFSQAITTLPTGLTTSTTTAFTGGGSPTSFTLVPGQIRTDIDQGFRGTGSVSDTIYHDIDGDGTQDVGEPGIVGATVTLTWAGPDGNLATATDNQTYTRTTGAGGVYPAFTNLPAGTFSVSAAAGNGLTTLTTTTLTGGGAPTSFTLTAGQTRTDADLGYRGTGSVSDTIYHDIDGDGTQDVGEPGIVGATVTLTWAGPDGNLATATDNLTYSRTTGASGVYPAFTNLPAGTFSVSAAAGNGLTTLTTTTLTGGGAPTSFTLTAGQTRTDADLGYRGTGSVSDTIYYDIDGDGTQDVGEPGIVGATVTLIWAGPDGNLATATDNLTYTRTTAAGGVYPAFTNLPAGTFSVSAAAPNGLTALTTTTLTGGGTPTSFTLTAAQTRTDADLGYRGTGTIGNFVFDDTNFDGVQNDGGAGVLGAIVSLEWAGPNGVFEASGATDDVTFPVQTTLASGAYSFTNLPSGNFQTTFTAPTGFGISPQGQGGNGTLDSDPNPTTGVTSTIALTAGATNNDIDAGMSNAADLSLVKSIALLTDVDGSTTVTPNDVVRFSITVTNTGPSNATGVAVGDVLPSGFTGATNISPGGTFDGTTITWTGLSVASGASITLTFDTTVNATGSYVNVAEITDSDQPDPDSAPDPTPDTTPPVEDDEATTTLVVTPAVDLSVVKSANDVTPNVGDTVTFTVTLSNATGLNTATNIVVRDLVPSGYTYVPASIGSNAGATGAIITPDASTPATGAGLGWSVDALDAGETVTLTFQALVLATGTYDNYTQITSHTEFDRDSTPGNDSTTEDDDDTLVVTPGAVADLELAKSIALLTDVDGSGANVTPNDVVRFSITVTNTGPSNATGVAVGDVLPSGFTGATNISPGGTFDGTTITWTGLSVASGANITLTFDTTVNATGSYVNVAEVTDSDQPDPDSNPDPTPDTTPPGEDDEATTTLVVTPAVDLSLVKSVALFTDVDSSGPGNVTPGDIVEFTITVTNTGPNDATGVSVGDLLPDGFTGATNISPGGTFDGTTITWTGLNIATGANQVLTFQTTVNSSGNFTNVAEITGIDQFDTDSDPDPTPDNDLPLEDDEASVTLSFTPAADLSLVKGIALLTDTDNTGLGNVTPSDVVRFSITVTNGGANDATGVAVGDLLPSGFTGASNISNGGSFDGTTITWTGLGIATGASITLTFDTVVNATGSYVNFAEITASDQLDPDSDPDPIPDNDLPGEDDEDTTTLIVTPVADLSITKTDGVTRYARNGTLVYTIVVTNTGPSNVTGATVADTFPVFFTNAMWNASATGGATNFDVTGTGNINDVVDMPAGSTITYIVTGTVASNATGNLVNTATITVNPQSGLIDPTPGNNTATDTDTPPGGGGGGSPPPPPPAGSISGSVYQDVNNDGIRQPGEQGIGGTTVTLVNATTGATVGTTTTAADGSYTFTGLNTGTYRVNESQPTGFADGRDTVGSAGGTLIPTDSIGSISVGPGTVATGYNFGEQPQTGISGTVFKDVNKDGDLQSGEVGIPGVTITLRDAAGNVVATTTTDANGNYSFPNVTPGTYTITETQPTQFGDPAGGPFAPNVRTVTVATTPVTNQNFGDTPGGISGTVYEDRNNDGIKQSGEPGIAGVTVTLFDAVTGAVVGTTTTAADGTYNFNGLPAGTYRVVESQPTGFTDGTDTVGTAGGTLVPTDTIDSIPVGPGILVNGYNFGELTSGNISGTVYLDQNQDSVYQQGSDTPLSGITVTLRNGTTVVATTTTDVNGNYSFTNVAPGTYTITETQPTGYVWRTEFWSRSLPNTRCMNLAA